MLSFLGIYFIVELEVDFLDLELVSIFKAKSYGLEY